MADFDLGLERAGMQTVWFCEQDEFCQRVLARHWPGVPCYSDVRSLVADPERGRLVDSDNHKREHPNQGRVELQAKSLGVVGEGDSGGEVPVPVSQVDVLCGGFPCQDLSVAGKGAGLDGERSGLWSEYARLIGELRPRYVIVENVPALLARGFGRVLGDLAALGYDAEWDCLPASAFGAPHRRDRVWIVAYPQDERHERTRPAWDGRLGPADSGSGSGADEGRPLHDALRRRHGASEGEVRTGRDAPFSAGWWATEPNVGRVANGVPNRVDRLRALGNALLPQIAEWIGSRVMEYERQTNPVRW